MEELRPDFIITPGIVAFDNELTPVDKDIYGIIYWFSSLKLQKCTASNSTIASILNTHPQTVSDGVGRLVKKNYVKLLIDKGAGNRRELIPLITYGPPLSVLRPTPISPQTYTSKSTDLPISNIDKEEELTNKQSFSSLSISSFTEEFPKLRTNPIKPKQKESENDWEALRKFAGIETPDEKWAREAAKEVGMSVEAFKKSIGL